jgi:hypothetical protein
MGFDEELLDVLGCVTPGHESDGDRQRLLAVGVAQLVLDPSGSP